MLLVSFHPPTHTRNWAKQYNIPFLLGSDTTRDTHGRYGLGEVGVADLLGPKSVLAGVKALIGTRTLPSHSLHYKQAGGYFVVDGRGIVLYAYPSSGPGDHPPIQELLQALGVI